MSYNRMGITPSMTLLASTPLLGMVCLCCASCRGAWHCACPALAALHVPVLVRLLMRMPARSLLLALHRTAVLRHDEYGQETLLNLLLRNYLHYNLYDQARPC